MQDRRLRAQDAGDTAGKMPALQSSGKTKLAIGGIAGLFVGVLVGVFTTAIVAIKSAKKLLLIPFK